MRVAVSVPRISPVVADNVAAILMHIEQAKEAGVELLLFPEAALTGLILSDDFSRDRLLGLNLNSAELTQIRKKAASTGIWVALGFLELHEAILYDSAILISDGGEVVLHYRRISKGWRHPKANPDEYGSGDAYTYAETPWGRVAFLICGDLFDMPQLAADVFPDLLLLPYARCFPESLMETTHEYQQEEWDRAELPAYLAQVKSIGVPTLMTNYIAPLEMEGGSFGGAYVLDHDAKILASLPLYREGVLVCDIPLRKI